MENTSAPFKKLAKFIGVFGSAENEKQESISMTAPVSLAPTDDAEECQMSFFLPKKYKTIEDVPRPERKDVTIRRIPERIVAVRTFSGSFRKRNVDKNEAELRRALNRDGIDIVDDDAKATVFGYNPPWTVPFFRTNEVLLPVRFDEQQE